MTFRNADIPAVGKVAYFIKLHLDTIKCSGSSNLRSDHMTYVVEGKERPMYIVSRNPVTRRGRAWMKVLPITSKGPSDKRALGDELIAMGRCIESGCESFISLVMLELPDNMLARTNGKARVVEPCDPLGFGSAIKLLNFRLMNRRRDS